MYNKSGSILIIMFIIVTIMSLMLYNTMRTSSFFSLIAFEREKYEKHYQMANTLLSIAQNEYKDQIKKLMAENINGDIALFSLSSFNENNDYNGRVSIKLKEKEQPIIQASVLKNEQVMIALSLHYIVI